MVYDAIYPAIFLERLNRFVAKILINNKVELCHVKNTGRCKELLIPKTPVYVQYSDNPTRKTKYSLITVKKKGHLFNLDSQAPNKVFLEWLQKEPLVKEYIIRPEFTYGRSRFDFFLENNDNKVLIEVKGVTLESKEIAYFPDAPTIRGLKHIEELIEAKNNGFETYIVFIIQFENAKIFKPNYITHKEFGLALQEAKAQGVHIMAMDTIVKSNTLDINKGIPVKLEMYNENPFEKKEHTYE